MTVEIEGVNLHLAHPDEFAVSWVGQDELIRQLLAAWMVVNDQDLPMNPRLFGKPGVGKTTLAYAAGKCMGRDVYILQALTSRLRVPKCAGQLAGSRNSSTLSLSGFAPPQQQNT